MQNVDVPILAILLNALVCATLSIVLREYYTRKVSIPIPDASISQTFILLSLATFIVISVVKSSLALSLGLVGALSIVRFRAPIKEPMELIFLFLAIAIGLGTGAGMSWQTSILLLLAISIHYFSITYLSSSKLHKASHVVNTNKVLILSTPSPNKINLINFETDILQKFTFSYLLNKIELSNDRFFVVYEIVLDDTQDIGRLINEIISYDSLIQVSLSREAMIW